MARDVPDMRTRHLLSGAALALTIATTACSSSSDDEAAAGAGSANPDAFDSPGEAALAFAQCMRDEGVEDFPDPQIDGGRVQISPGGIDPDDPDVQAAQETCSPLLEQGGDVEIDEERSAEVQAAALAFAECMRSHGIDFPDPQVDGGRVLIGGGPGAEFDPNSVEFQDALAACEAEVPAMRGGPQP